MIHVDEFIEYGPTNNFEMGHTSYARWILMHFRLSALLRSEFDEFIKGRLLFCTYDRIRYRCTGASRLGDVWLTRDFDQSVGYQSRVDPFTCSLWSSTP